ncbi:MAG: hypothetical protein AAFO83_07695 [Cyanobacteria bacterium J06607_13]
MFEHLSPKSAEVRYIAGERTNALDLHQTAIDFQQEVAYRQAFEDYCQWYYRLAQQNQAEMKAMQNDADSFVWWWGR